MLLQRVLTSFVLLAIVLGAVFGLQADGFSVFIALVIAAAVWEWSALAGFRGTAPRIAYLALMLVLMAITKFQPLSLEALFLAGLLCWLLAFWLICLFPAGRTVWGTRLALGLAGIPLFIPGWLGFIYLRAQDFYSFHLLLMPALVAAADIGAYFSGRAFGRHKLAPRVSPNKTWEGVLGGMLGCAALIVLATVLFIAPRAELTGMLWLALIGGALAIAVFSVIGDLFESMVKRFRDVKDSGNLLPGHGGMLDRIDGLTAAAPLYALLLMELEPRLL